MHASVERAAAAGGARIWPWWAMAAALPLLMLAALCIGRYALPPSRVFEVLLAAALPGSTQAHGVDWRVVLQLRLPRILLAALVGAGLAVCGAALQGCFRNPLVGPQVLGISSGAAFGGCLAIVFFASLPAILIAAFVFGVLATALVYLLARTQRRTTVLMLILAGVVVGAWFAALISLVTYLADPDDAMQAIVFWLMGSFATASWAKLGAVLLPIAAGVGLLHALRFRLNVLSLGDEQAAALGVAVEPLRWAVLACVALVVSASVAVTGTVGWVGLVVPHVARMLVGADHRLLLPASALLGAGFTVLVDTLARSASGAEIPLGVITALVGAPVFGVLLRRRVVREGVS